MTIWVDADACPAVIKEILFRAAIRTQIPLKLVANQPLKIQESPWISFILVRSGFDAADNEIVKQMAENDLVITADIPLAAEVLAQNGQCINPRGEIYSKDTIRARLSMRNFMEELRSAGVDTGGPSALNSKDRNNFANSLDQILRQVQN